MYRLLAVSTLLHAFVALRLLAGLRDAGIAGGWVASMGLYLAVSAVMIPLALLSRPMPQPRRDRLAWPGFVMMGVFSTLWALTVLRDLALIAGAVAWESLPAGWLERFHDLSAIAIAPVAAAFSLCGFVLARRRPPVRTVEIAIDGLPAALRGFTIAQISDLHVGATIKRGYVQAVADAVNALDADMVAITGDLVDGSVEQLAADVAPLSGLRSRHGTYFVTGNHEYYSGAHAWIAELHRLGMTVLLNEHVVLSHQGAPVVVAGVADHTAHHFDPSHACNPERAVAGAPACGLRLLLAHQPRSAGVAAHLNFHLQLSGHTHGGQFLPWQPFVRLQQPYVHGLHRAGDTWVYVSRGTGYWGPPLRLGAPSEITRLVLRNPSDMRTS